MNFIRYTTGWITLSVQVLNVKLTSLYVFRNFLQEMKQKLRCKFKYIRNPKTIKPDIEDENLDVQHVPPELENLKPR